MFTTSRLRAVARHLIPNIGTLILLLLFFYVQSVGANPFKSMLSGPADVRISYQGRLTAPDGQPLTGSYEMSFALYTTETGGSSFWSETYDALAVTGGLLNVHLGSATPLPDPLPDGNLYLGITIGGEELGARQPLSSGYHALGSTYAVNVPDLSIDTAQLANNGVTSDKIASGAVESSDIAGGAVTSDKLDVDNGLAIDGDLTVAGNITGEYLCCGHTNTDGTGWVNYSTNGIYINVDTSTCNFPATPMYFTSLGGSDSHWTTIGVTSIYFPSATGFRIYLNLSGITPAIADNRNLHTQWCGIKQKTSGVDTGG